MRGTRPRSRWTPRQEDWPLTTRFPPGITSKSVAVLVNPDRKCEDDETFFVHLTNPVAATIADSEGGGTILNDDCGPP